MFSFIEGLLYSYIMCIPEKRIYHGLLDLMTRVAKEELDELGDGIDECNVNVFTTGMSYCACVSVCLCVLCVVLVSLYVNTCVYSHLYAFTSRYVNMLIFS